MIGADLRRAAKRVLALSRAKELRIATAESCTGGLVAAALTEIAGSSDVVDCGFVTYSDAAKQKMLGVPKAILSRHGAVSAATAAAMAKGALKHSQADLSVAITGIAGPGGAPSKSPSGWFISPPQAVTAGASHAAGATARSGARACGCVRSCKRWHFWNCWPNRKFDRLAS